MKNIIFGVYGVGYPTSSTVFMLVDSRYCGSFNNNCSGCMFVFTIILARRKEFILLWNPKKEISSFQYSKASSGLTWKYFPPTEKKPIGCKLSSYRILSSIGFLGITLLETLHSYQCQVHLRQRPPHKLIHSIPTQKILHFTGL